MEKFPGSSKKNDKHSGCENQFEGDDAGKIESDNEREDFLGFFRSYREEKSRKSKDFGPDGEIYLKERVKKIFTWPKEAMASAVFYPSYVSMFTLVIFNAIIGVLLVGTIYPKFRFTGAVSAVARDYATTQFMLECVYVPIATLLMWLAKILFVYYLCGGEGSWSYETAASVTAYSYIPRIVIGMIASVGSWVYFPVFTVDIGNITDPILFATTLNGEIAKAMMDLWWFVLPFWIFALFWASYLGAKGTYQGTHGKCSEAKAYAVFFVFGVFALVIEFLSIV